MANHVVNVKKLGWPRTSRESFDLLVRAERSRRRWPANMKAMVFAQRRRASGRGEEGWGLPRYRAPCEVGRGGALAPIRSRNSTAVSSWARK